MTNQCDHGQLARVCPLCEKDREIERLRAENKRLRALAEFGRQCLDAGVRPLYAAEFGLTALTAVTQEIRNQCKSYECACQIGVMCRQPTELAQLPEESKG